MKATKLLLSSAVLGLAFFTGCDEGTTPSAVADKAAETAKDGAAAVKDAANTAADKAGDLAAQAGELLKDPKAAFDKLQGLVDTKKWTEAKGLLDQLMALKDKLPAEWASKLEAFAKTITEGLKSVGGN